VDSRLAAELEVGAVAEEEFVERAKPTGGCARE
jgi:hypothetical protein